MDSPVVAAPARYTAVTEMFWVAEYNNGQALPELDPTTGFINSFSQVDHKKTIRFWWLPITPAMTKIFPFTRFNPRLCRHAVDLKGSKGFVARRHTIKISMGKKTDTPAEKLKRLLKPPEEIKCYILGIEGGPRQEIYPDGTVINKPWPDKAETQDLLHH